MKKYPKIEYYNKGILNNYIYAFDKLDGSNIRAEWSKSKGWYKFGTRNTMIDENNPDFGEAITLFLDKYGESLPKVFKNHKSYKKSPNFVVFCEYLGENSFAGRHVESDIKDIILFDVNMYRHGFITPKNFIEDFGHLHIPKIVYEGLYTEEFIDEIRQNKYNLKEGVIVKGITRTKNNKDEVWMVKVKTLEWLRKVKELHGQKYLLNEVNKDVTIISEI